MVLKQVRRSKATMMSTKYYLGYTIQKTKRWN